MNMQHSAAVAGHRQLRSFRSLTRLALVPVAIFAAIMAGLFVFGGSGGDIVSVSSTGDFTETQWFVPVSDLPAAANEIRLDNLRFGGISARAH